MSDTDAEPSDYRGIVPEHRLPVPPALVGDPGRSAPSTVDPGVPERVVKLARSAMRAHAARMLRDQGGLCPLCQKDIDLRIKGEGVIDHDHDTGRIRGLLHRSCNAAEGKISNSAARWGAKSSSYVDIIAYLKQVVDYLSKTPSNLIYPMHKTLDEKKEARLAKAREAKAVIRAKRALAQQRREGTTE